MSKVEKTENALTVKKEATSFLPSVEQIEEIITPESGAYLPLLELVFPIMTNDIYEGHNWEFGFKNGTDFQPLTKGTTLSVIDMRNAIKRTYQSEQGKKNEYAYSSIKRNGKLFNKSIERFNELLEDAEDRDNRDVNLGVSMVVAAIIDDKTTILNFSAFKTVNGYMFNVLEPAKFQQGLGVRIDIQNHKPNLVKAKSTGFLYPSRTKFTQWEHIKLTKEYGQKILEAIQNNAEGYMSWLDQ